MAAERSNKLILVVSSSPHFLKEAELLFQKIDPPDFDILLCKPEDALGRSHELHPVSLLIDLGGDNLDFEDPVEKVINAYSLAHVVGSQSPSDASRVVRFVKMGVKNFMEYPLKEEEVESLLVHLRALNKDKNEEDRSAGVICIYGPKGGVGVTTLVVNLAAAIRKNPEKKVAILDITPNCGDVATLLNVQPEYTLRDLLNNIHLLDKSFLRAAMVKSSEGIEIMAAPREDQETLKVDDAGNFGLILDLLRTMFDILIVDVSRIDFLILKKVLADTSRVLVVGTQDVPCLKGLVSAFHFFSKMGFDSSRIQVVLNRYDSKFQLESVMKEFEKRTGQGVKWFLSSQYPVVSESINRGCSIYDVKAKTDLGSQIDKMAQKLVSEVTVPAVKS